MKRHAFIFSFLLSALFNFGSPCAGKAQDSPAGLEKTAGEYFAKHDYDGFYQYVTSALADKKAEAAEAYYYLALARQKTIDHWQEKKDWEGVYDKAEDFKKEIVQNLKKAEAEARDNQALSLKIKYLKWRSAKDDEADSGVTLFSAFVDAAKGLSGSVEAAGVIKQIADELSGLEDKNLSRRLYEIYVVKLLEAKPAKEELKRSAELFLAEKNIYLAKTLLDAYLEQFADDKTQQAREMVAVAAFFAHSGSADGLDPVFAESMYQKAFESAGMEAFDADSQHRRAFNLERTKEHSAAATQYKKFLDGFPDHAGRAAVLFRLGVLSAYALKDPAAAAQYFMKVREEAKSPSLVLSSLYQLGLLSQYRGDTEKAKEFYGVCLESAKAQVPTMEASEICRLAAERLLEIEETKEIKYGIKLFLDAALKQQEAGALALNVDVTGRPFIQAAAAPVRFVVTTSAPATGCMTPVYAYEWSGEVGSLAQVPNAPEITTDYLSGGVKVVHVAVVGPNGLEGAGFDMVEITEKP